MTRARRAAEFVASTAPDAATAAGAAALAIAAGPGGAIAGAAAAPVVSRVLMQLAGALGARRDARVVGVIARAAQLAGLEPAVLVQRLQASPEQEELLVRTMQAAADAAAEERLVMLATSLGHAATGTPLDAGREALFVRAIAELELLHVQLLERFTWSANALGLGDGASPEFDTPIQRLNEKVLERVLPELGVTTAPLLSALVRHGLLAYSTPSVATYGGGGSLPPVWELTAFGAAFLERLSLVRTWLAPRPAGIRG